MLLAMGLEAQIAAKPAGRDRLARVRRLIAEAEQCGGIHEFLARLKASGDRRVLARKNRDIAVGHRLEAFRFVLFVDVVPALSELLFRQTRRLLRKRVRAMLSAIGGFTDGELVRIRARFPSPFTFREACASGSARPALSNTE